MTGLWFSAIVLLTVALTCLMIVGAGASLLWCNNTKHHHHCFVGVSKAALPTSADLVVSSVSLQHPDGRFIHGQEKGQIKTMGKYNWRYTCLSVREYACLLFD